MKNRLRDLSVRLCALIAMAAIVSVSPLAAQARLSGDDAFASAVANGLKAARKQSPIVAGVSASGVQAKAWRSYFHSPLPSRGAASPCPSVAPIVVGGTQGYSDAVTDNLCFVSIDPADAVSMIYRDYTFFSDGMMLVFNSYGAQEGPTMTSGREYYFFPRARLPRLEMNAKAGAVSVIMADGGRATFTPATAQIASLDRGNVTVSPNMERSARGGVEISHYRGLLLDAGFHLGQLPSSSPNGQSTFRSAKGQTCTVTNSEIFVYKGFDSSFKFDDAGLSAFLKKRCPGLPVGF